MRAGRLRHRIAIEQQVLTDDGAGGVTEEWVEIAAPYAAVIPLGGDELFAAQQTMPRVSHRIEMRYMHDIESSTMRVVFRERVFDIEAVLNIDERDRELHLYCEELR